MSKTYDIVVIGGGHNGLTAAIALAKKNKKVLVWGHTGAEMFRSTTVRWSSNEQVFNGTVEQFSAV